jgi:hypothetical protein
LILPGGRIAAPLLRIFPLPQSLKGKIMKKLLLALAVAVAAAAAAPKPASNTLCPVLGNPVTAQSKTVVVRGREYRVCCMGCPEELKAQPDKFLKPDGTPKNAK